MLVWEEEGQSALITDPKEPVWSTTPLSGPDKSIEKRTGTFKLLPDGTLEGTAKIQFTGHVGAYHKEYNDDDTPQQREETLKNLVKSKVLSSAEISDISIENISDPDGPFTYTFKLRVPGYAARTGKRIFLQPNVFERNSKPMFESAKRRFEIYFPYAYGETDEITIELPEGYELESPDAPPLMKDKSGVGVNAITISVSADKRLLRYQRDFRFGNNGTLRFGQEVYPALKGLFDAFYQGNTHALTLKQSSIVANERP
jgi:hypothetical protein